MSKKKKPRRTLTTGVFAAMSVIFLSALLWQNIARKQNYVISSGGNQGLYYAFSQKLAEIANDNLTGLRLEVISSNGSGENLTRIQSSECSFAIVQSDVAGGSKIASIANLYQEVLHLVARKDSNIKRYQELDGKTVNLGPAGSGTALIATKLLEFVLPATNGFTTRNATSAEAVQLLSKGEIDAAFFMSGIGAESIEQLLENDSLCLVPLLRDRDDNTVQDSVNIVDGFRTSYPQATPAIIPLGTYGRTPDKPVPSVGVFATLVCSSTTSDQVIYDLTELIFSQKPILVREFPIVAGLNEANAINGLQFPLHPGADSYFRRTQPSFLQENAELIGLILSAFLALWAAASAIRKKISLNKKDFIDTFYIELRKLEQQSDRANNEEEISNTKKSLEQLKSHALDELINERLKADDSYVIFLQMVDHLYLVIEKQEQALGIGLKT